MKLLSAQMPALTPAAQLASPTAQGKLVEISGESATARTTAAVRQVVLEQLEGGPVAWIQPAGGRLYPPDLAESGVDLGALVVIHVPQPAAVTGMLKAAEMLLRSGAFGLLVVDLSTQPAVPGSSAWQGRLLGLARHHHSNVVFLTSKATEAASLGPLIGLRLEPRRQLKAPGVFVVQTCILKNKAGQPHGTTLETRRGPWGLL